jgi:HAMP domain-containing protein
VRRMATLLGTALALTLLVALVAALAAARRVTRPLAELTTAAHDVGRGAPPGDRGALRRRDRHARRRVQSHGGGPRRAEHRLVEAAKFAFVGELAAGRPRGAHAARRAPQLDAAPRAHARPPTTRPASCCTWCATRSIGSKASCRACSSSAGRAAADRAASLGRSSGGRRISSTRRRRRRASPSSGARARDPRVAAIPSSSIKWCSTCS